MPNILPATEQSDFCRAVRAAIDISLTSDDLADEIVMMGIYYGQAETWALALDANAGSYGPEGTNPTPIRQAAVISALTLKTASLLCPAVPNITREDFGQNEAWVRQAMDYGKRAEELAGLASEAIVGYLETAPVVAMLPTVFSVAPGRRGM